MDLIDVIKGCSTIEEIEVLEWVFNLDERHRKAALWQRIIIWSDDMERDYENETHGVLCPDLLTGWSEEQRELFNTDWNRDLFLDGLEEPITHVLPDRIQTGEGSRKRPVEVNDGAQNFDPNLDQNLKQNFDPNFNQKLHALTS